MEKFSVFYFLNCYYLYENLKNRSVLWILKDFFEFLTSISSSGGRNDKLSICFETAGKRILVDWKKKIV